MQKYLIHLKKLTQIAIPIVIVEAGSQLTHVIDTIMVGKIGSIYIAASSLANYLYLIPLLFGIGSTMSITPLTGNANGAGNLSECKKLFSNAFFVQLINGILITTITLCIGLLIPFVDSDSHKVSLAQSYYNYLVLSSLPLVLLFTFKGYLDGFGFTIYGMFAVLFGNLLNVLLNWLLIYGNCGFPALALDGAGLATFISRIMMVIFIVFISVINSKTRKLLVLPKLSHISKSKVKEFFKYGLHIGTQSSVEIASFTLIVIFAGWLGTQSAAAYQICISISGLCYLSSLGIGAASTVLISNYKGAGDTQGIKEASKTIIGLTLVFTFLFTIVLIFGTNVFTSFFVKEMDVAKLASSLLFIMALFQIPDGMNAAVTGILRGLLDTKIPMILNSLSFWGLMIPLSYIFGFVFELGIIGIMYGIVSGILICAIAIVLRFIYTSRRIFRKDKHYLY